MKRVVIYRSNRFEVVSYGNGMSYAVHDNTNKQSMFVLSCDDATEFRNELEVFEATFPNASYDDFYAEQLATRR